MDVQALASELREASPRTILTRAHELFGAEVAIAFSGAEDVLLLEFCRQAGLAVEVFCLDTGRLHPETYRYLATVERHYGLRIAYTFPDAQEVTSLVRQKGLFSFYDDGHSECCQVRKVNPLRRHLAGLRAWITGQRHDQNPATRGGLAVVERDAVFRGKDGEFVVKWNPLASLTSADVWDAILAFDVPYNPLHRQGYRSIGCEPCTRAIAPGEEERAGRWWWENAEKKECGIHLGPGSASS